MKNERCNSQMMKITMKIPIVSRISIILSITASLRDVHADNEKFPPVEYFHQKSLDLTAIVQH